MLAAVQRYGVSRATMARMGANIAIDHVIGIVPFAGDRFDVFWKSNQKNVALLRRNVSASPGQLRRHRVDGLAGGRARACRAYALLTRGFRRVRLTRILRLVGLSSENR